MGHLRIHSFVAFLFMTSTASVLAQDTGTVTVTGTGTAGVKIQSTSAVYPDVLVKLGNASTAAFRVFNSADTELLAISTSGDVIVGGGTSTSYGTSDRFYVFENDNAATSITVDNPNGGLNTTALLRAYTDTAGINFAAHGSGRTGLIRFGAGMAGWAEILQWRGNGLAIGTNIATPLILGTNNINRLHIAADGKIGIGTAQPNFTLDVVGNANFSGTVTGGNIQAKYQDVAEWVPAREDLEPGTVVVVDTAVGNSVLASTTAYDTRVAGVISEQPGIILGEAGPSMEQVATTGRVRVKVDATKHPIGVGDLLVTSDKAGYAMRSIPLDLAGNAIHRPGTIVGKALEALASGEGEVLVLLSLQ